MPFPLGRFNSQNRALVETVACIDHALGADVTELKVALGDDWRCDVFHDGRYAVSIWHSFGQLSPILQQLCHVASDYHLLGEVTLQNGHEDAPPAWHIRFNGRGRRQRRLEFVEAMELVEQCL